MGCNLWIQIQHDGVVYGFSLQLHVLWHDTGSMKLPTVGIFILQNREISRKSSLALLLFWWMIRENLGGKKSSLLFLVLNQKLGKITPKWPRKVTAFARLPKASQGAQGWHTVCPSQGLLLPRSLCGPVRGKGALEPLTPQHKDDWAGCLRLTWFFIHSCGALMDTTSVGFSKCFVLKESTTSLGSMEFNICFLYPVFSHAVLLHCAVWSYESGTYSLTFNKMHIRQPFQYLFVHEPLLC